ncbi:NADPH--cytochrome P450 reductase [Pseudocercospora fuligena]|uniref:NADPH--cytochrome P450 reductase n=1 Tax=Pseudocercospora fuligena TaxID=685502 RepID=A0A8H6RQ54_9PEZI|nr:NADPH--cytochrome P450 reductase [Pseudocercospora fuligena]
MANMMETPSLQPLNLVDLEKALRSLPQHIGADDVFAISLIAAAVAFYYYMLREQPDPYLYKMYERPQEHMSKGGPKATRDISEKLDQLGADIVIFWGSQSGTAERMANRLSKEIRQRFGKKALAADASDYEPASIAKLSETKVALFIVSTFGEGDPSDNIHDLWSWLESAKGQPLKNLNYAALGLGNSNYKYYNAVVDIVSEKLGRLGGQALLPTGKADDAHGQTEEHYLEWKTSVFQLLKDKMGLVEHDPVYEPSISVVEDYSMEPIDLYNGEPWMPDQGRKAQRLMSPIHSLPVKATRELFDDASERNCIHMEVDLNEYPGLKYKTGDHLGVWAVNPQPEVDCLLQSLGLTSSRVTPISFKSLDAETKLKVPTPTSTQALFANYLEICAQVSRETIAALIQFAPNQGAKETLARLSNDKAAYDALSEKMYLNLGRLLQHVAPGDGVWHNLPLSFVVESLPAMQPRYYSISSSSVVHARQISITAVVSDKRMAGDAIVPGLCTNHLLGVQRRFLGQEKTQETRINAFVRKSTFKLPALQSQPIVMIAAGTGIAPFRGFLQERARLMKMGREIGRTILFFGCRNEAQDYLYKSEIQEFLNMPGLNLSVVTAFSRPADGQKIYVQQRVQENADEICDLVANRDANFYICGSAAMARDVSKILGSELQARKGWSDDELRSFMDKQKRSRRWQQDVWG